MTTSDIRTLNEISGLYMTQLGRLFGVTTRQVTDWMVFDTVPTRYEARLERILDVVSSVDAGTPEETRAALLSSANGRSLFHQLLDGAPEHQQVRYDGVSVRDRIAL